MSKLWTRKRRRQAPGFMGVVVWGSYLWCSAFLSVVTGGVGHLVFGIAFVVLLVLCLWFYGVLPVPAKRPLGASRDRDDVDG